MFACLTYEFLPATATVEEQCAHFDAGPNYSVVASNDPKHARLPLLSDEAAQDAAMRTLLRPRIAGIRAVNEPKFKVGDIANWTNDYSVDLGARTIVRVDADVWVVCYYVPPTDTPPPP